VTIYVDPLRQCPGPPGQFERYWAHLMTDGPDKELHAFAARIRLKRQWFQGDHYDLGRRRYADALALGAVKVTTRELVRLRQKRREGA